MQTFFAAMDRSLLLTKFFSVILTDLNNFEVSEQRLVHKNKGRMHYFPIWEPCSGIYLESCIRAFSIIGWQYDAIFYKEYTDGHIMDFLKEMFGAIKKFPTFEYW